MMRRQSSTAISVLLIGSGGLFLPFIARGGTVSAVILGENEIKIKAKSQGQVSSIAIEEGIRVKAGDVLAILDDRQEKIERDLASVEFQIAEKDFEKTKSLSKYVSEEEIIKKKNDFLRKKSVYDLKEYNFSNKRVTAPIDGVVTRKYFSPGDTVASGDRIFDIVQLENLVLEIYIDPKDAAKFSKGQTISFKTDLQKDKEFSATIVFISPVVDAASNTVRIRATIKNPPLPEGGFEIKPGTVATVNY